MVEKCMIRIEDASVRVRAFVLGPGELEIPKGYIIGVTGENGAGKTTFLNMLLGRYKKMQGKIYIDDLEIRKDKSKIMQKVGLVSQAHAFFWEEDAKENAKYYARFYPDWNMEEYYRMLQKMGLSKKQRLGSFSNGERVKYQLAFAAAYRPKVLLLDEPTADLDPVFRDEFLTMLQEFVAEYETTVLFSTHLEADLLKIADYVIEIVDGRYQMREVVQQ